MTIDNVGGNCLPRNHISVSQLNTYLRCPAQYYFKYVKDIRFPANSYLTKGKAVHKGIEKNYLQKIETRKDLELEEVQAETADAFDRYKPEAEWEKDEDPGEVKDESIQLVTLYHTKLAPKIQPVYVEQRLEFEIGYKDYTFLGFADVIDEQGYIRDIKTSKRTPNKEMADRSIQLTMYTLAYRTLTGKKEKGVVLDYLIQTKTPKTETLVSTRTLDDISRTLRMTYRIIDAIERGIFYPNPTTFLCDKRWCKYWDMCHDKF